MDAKILVEPAYCEILVLHQENTLHRDIKPQNILRTAEGETYILIVRNALYMPSMDLNLIPPFIMRAGGVQVNDMPKIHCDDPTTNGHCITLPQDIAEICDELCRELAYIRRYQSSVPA